MSQDIVVELKKREIIGKGLNKLRREGSVPAVIHDHGRDSINVMGQFQDFVNVYSKAGKHHAVHLKLDSKDQLAIIKQVDFDPKKHQIRHIVFQAIKQNEKIQTEVPIELEGDIPAELVGLMVIRNLDTVEVEALPNNLPDKVVVDATKLSEIGDKIHVSDIKQTNNVVVLTEPESIIATVEETKAQISEESEEADAAEGDDATEASESSKEDNKPNES
ncbi:MAG: 50S ribosomal protein L25 [Candidatus Saccharimonadales bacterium]